MRKSTPYLVALVVMLTGAMNNIISVFNDPDIAIGAMVFTIVIAIITAGALSEES